MKNFLEIDTTGLMTLYINGQRVELVYIPTFEEEEDTHAVVTYTLGTPGIDDNIYDYVPIVQL